MDKFKINVEFDVFIDATTKKQKEKMLTEAIDYFKEMNQLIFGGMGTMKICNSNIINISEVEKRE